MKISTCPACKGKKKMINGSGMLVPCDECNGVGVINEDANTEVAKEMISPPINKPRRGRKPKK